MDRHFQGACGYVCVRACMHACVCHVSTVCPCSCETTAPVSRSVSVHPPSSRPSLSSWPAPPQADREQCHQPTIGLFVPILYLPLCVRISTFIIICIIFNFISHCTQHCNGSGNSNNACVHATQLPLLKSQYSTSSRVKCSRPVHTLIICFYTKQSVNEYCSSVWLTHTKQFL